MQLCPPVYWNRESQNSQDASCSIYVLWKTWLKRKTKKKKKMEKNSYALLLLSAIMWSVKRRKRMRARYRQGQENRAEWFSSSTDRIEIVTGDWALRTPPPKNYHHHHHTSFPSAPSDACHCSSPSLPPSLRLTRGVCEVSPKRHRFKDGIYKIHTEPTFNCLWRTSPAAFDVQT